MAEGVPKGTSNLTIYFKGTRDYNTVAFCFEGTEEPVQLIGTLHENCREKLKYLLMMLVGSQIFKGPLGYFVFTLLSSSLFGPSQF